MFRELVTSAIIFIFILPILVSGQVATSTNYQIERDSINIGGGFSTSTNYGLEDTVGGPEPQYATSTNYILLAGYQKPEEASISITINSPSDVNMDSISGLVGGVSTSTVAWTLTTNNGAGYSLSIKSVSSPALSSSNDFFADYVPSGAAPDYNWSIETTSAEFGYSVTSADVVTKFKDDGSTSCNTGSSNTSQKCWYGFSTSDEAIATKASANTPAGTETTVELQAESGTNKILTAGNYSATLVVTGLAL